MNIASSELDYKRQLVALQREITDLKVFKELLLQKQSDKIVVLSIFVDLPSGRNLSGAIRSSSGTVTDRSLLYADSIPSNSGLAYIRVESRYES